MLHLQNDLSKPKIPHNNILTVSCWDFRSGSRTGGRTEGVLVQRWLLCADARDAVGQREAQDQVGISSAQPADG